jgi:hypothetical protein
MKKMMLITLNVIIIGGMLIYSANAFQKGENRIGNGIFESDKVGELPVEWETLSGG